MDIDHFPRRQCRNKRHRAHPSPKHLRRVFRSSTKAHSTESRRQSARNLIQHLALRGLLHDYKSRTLNLASIVVTASEAGIYNLHLDPIYCATKYALVSLTRSLLAPLLPDRITMNAILPGFVPTTITSRLLPITSSDSLAPLSTIAKAIIELMEGELTG
jgi:NAD(P)-dependent dehydrogenase (short-subunit alcohol dehydrogenase family)